MNAPRVCAMAYLSVVLTACGAAGQGSAEESEIPRESEPEHAWVIFGSDSVRAEVARTESQRERGLMLRESVPDGTGMLFVFPEAEVQGVWMKDTYVPLTAAFMDGNFTVLSIERLEPEDPTVKYSEDPVMYVLEVPQGWFEAHGVTPGDRATVVFEGTSPRKVDG
ncbi:MAG: DUF192 domain-containing protein [Gemmatimonadota bacterium]|nr:DUF192 domain-containing protein [Gemmatimonadota bacterium]